MTSAAKIAANQANAQHSTGPCTPEGKAKVAQNGVTLGLFSGRDVILPHEQAEYDELRAGLEAELQPATIMERTLAMEILHATWRLRRCSVVEASLTETTLVSGLDPMEDTASSRTQASIDRARAQARNNLRRSTDELSRLQTERRLRAETAADSAALVNTVAVAKGTTLLRKQSGLDSFSSMLRAAIAQIDSAPAPITKQTQRAPNDPAEKWGLECFRRNEPTETNEPCAAENGPDPFFSPL